MSHKKIKSKYSLILGSNLTAKQRQQKADILAKKKQRLEYQIREIENMAKAKIQALMELLERLKT